MIELQAQVSVSIENARQRVMETVQEFGREKERLRISAAETSYFDVMSAVNDLVKIAAATVPEGALHASAPPDHHCADCEMDKEPCPTCYHAWWTKRHPNTLQIGGFAPTPEEWQLVYLALATLVRLKDYKDKNGADEFYENEKWHAWKNARVALTTVTAPRR